MKVLDNNTVSGQSKVITNPLYDATVGIKDMSNSLSVTTSLSLEYMLLKNLKQAFKFSLLTKIGYLLVKPGMKGLKKKLSTSEYGGAVLLGINKAWF